MENNLNESFDSKIEKNLLKEFEYINSLDLSLERIKNFKKLEENSPDTESIKLALEVLPLLFSAGVPPYTHVEQDDIIVFG